MLDKYLNKRRSKKIEKHIFKTLKKVYGRKGAKIYAKLIKIIFNNLALRYNLSVRQVWNCLPLKVFPRRKIDGAYGKNYIKRGINYSGIDISRTATYNTFIHEFGHYLKKLICFIYATYTPSLIMLKDIKRMNVYVGTATKTKSIESINVFTWNVDQEEAFAYSWERYALNANTKVYPEIFEEIRKHLMKDISRRSTREVEHAYDLVETTDDLLDLFNNFIKTTERNTKIPALMPSAQILAKQRMKNNIKKGILYSFILIILLALIYLFYNEIIYFLKYLLYYLLNNRIVISILDFFKIIILKIRLM